ncbi:MAG: SDR family oxidoreductase [Xenococcaceae cyanobacterium MO_188.B32]|nr:SDR family oxidoreductase [Xenococcaceae cyanobacterium MO_188.B32]
METIQYKRAAGLYYSREEAEAAVRALRDAGFDMDRVSVIAKDTDRVAGHESTEEIGNKADEGAATGAIAGGALGGITGLLVGLGALAIPGIGPILLAGAEATAIATTLAGAGIGAAAGSLVGALVGLGIPEEKAKIYSDRVAGGSYLLMVTGTAADIARAESIMRNHGVEEFDVYNVPNSTATAPRAEAADTDNIKLYEERLVVDKDRAKTGEVSIGKRVETQTANVSVPVEKEKIVVERVDATDGTVVNPATVDFNEEEVARIDVYEESADISKQAFVREEVNVRKEVETAKQKILDRFGKVHILVNCAGITGATKDFKDGILVNSVSPAYIATPMTDAMMEKRAEEKGMSFEKALDTFLEEKRPHLELKRRGKAQEVAAVIAFLCSQHSSFVVGANYRVDGGSVATVG